jgi:hypothetical protein
MNIKQAASILTKLGFTMNPPGANCEHWGRKSAEPFYTSDCILSTPFRDVFIGKAKGGWYVTSHIKFKARRKHARSYNMYDASVSNIFGHGHTLELAIMDFVKEYTFKVHGTTFDNFQMFSIISLMRIKFYREQATGLLRMVIIVRRKA